MNLIPRKEEDKLENIKMINNDENKIKFDIEILKELGNTHIELMELLNIKMNDFNTNRDIYDYINAFVCENYLNLAFPIGISINQVIAHDTYHPNNLITLKEGDFVTIDVGFYKEGNIIDAARTFTYKNELHKSINDCKSYVDKIEDYIRNELNKNGFVNIQRISKMTELLVNTGGYTGVSYLGGHNVELGKVHGSKLILNKPLTSLHSQAANLVDKNATLSRGEMFCIEIYMGEKLAEGQMIKSTKIPVTHFELYDKVNKDKMTKREVEIYDSIMDETEGYAYNYSVHERFNKNKKILEEMIKKEYIIPHHPLEYKASMGTIIKFTQHENTFLINEKNKLINLTKNKN